MKLLILSLLAFFFLPLHAVNVVTDPFPPAKFTSLYIERDEKGSTTSLQLTGDAVIYRTTFGGAELENITVHPSQDDWFKFIQGLNAAKVYKWAPQYEYPGQGGTWVIDLAMDDRKFTSGGTNEFPKDGAEDQPQADPKAGPSVPFQLFWQAALGLVGKAPVKADAPK